jgi:hypothetical protein
MAVHKIDGVDGVVNYPKKFVTLWASDAITKGDCVQIHESTTYGIGLTVEQCDENDSNRAVGIAMGTVADGEKVTVQVAGYNDIATAQTVIDLWDLVGSDTDTDGRIQCLGGHATTGAGSTALTNGVVPFALCIKAYTAGNADGAIMVYDHGFYG